MNLCVYYAVFTGNSPVGLVFEVPDIAIKPEHESSYKDSKHLTLDAPTAAYLQRLAAETATKYAAWHRTRLASSRPETP